MEAALRADQATAPADEGPGHPRIEDMIAFDIPPQSLLTALRSYSEITGQAVLVDNGLAAGRRSAGAHGHYSKTEALQQLLAGTGLVASYSSDQAFTLKLAEPGQTVVGTEQERTQVLGTGDIEAVIERYAGKIQNPIEAALCQSDETRPGTYRLALQVWITASGRVERTALLGVMNNPSLAARVQRTLDALRLDPPPPGLPQPLTLLLLPGRATEMSACSAASPFVH
ncbi:TonB-dependent outer membrane receptor [Dyella monticola]|uniref:TonB-dependent outer membrane receptor n=1 Tax=Dyella monticola TaxID=1927958 RepID=A0A370X0C7_9GAMM|nr:TonB-dependent outer membrane receptor [Dyella monticola]